MSYTLTPFDGEDHGFTLTAEVRNRIDLAFIEFSLLGDCSQLALPQKATGRADELWQDCTFELFVKDAHSSHYREYNFSLSGQWNAYDFTDSRTGQTEAAIDEPDMMARMGAQAIRLSVVLPWSCVAEKQGTIAAVLKRKDGTYSYWATEHAHNKPDFHTLSAMKVLFQREDYSIPDVTGKDRAEGILNAINEHNNS